MPATSIKQQNFMGMVRSVQKGLNDKASGKVKEVAASMDPQDVKDFASTKHDDLPESVDKDKKD